MCGRYYVDEGMAEELSGLIGRMGERPGRGLAGDVHPGGAALVITGRGADLSGEWLTWGFPSLAGKGLLINARAETAMEKNAFGDSMQNRRCVIPARGFYEWNRAKEKAAFSRPGGGLLYMAGCFGAFEGGERFVILTTQANGSVSRIHGRMPLLLERGQVRDWILDRGEAKKLLGQIPAPLEAAMEYEQQTLDFL